MGWLNEKDHKAKKQGVYSAGCASCLWLCAQGCENGGKKQKVAYVVLYGVAGKAIKSPMAVLDDAGRQAKDGTSR